MYWMMEVTLYQCQKLVFERKVIKSIYGPIRNTITDDDFSANRIKNIHKIQYYKVSSVSVFINT